MCKPGLQYEKRKGFLCKPDVLWNSFSKPGIDWLTFFKKEFTYTYIAITTPK